MIKRLTVSFEVILLLLVLISHCYAIFSPPNSLMNWFLTDDAFYYYKTAQNISEGNGISFDQISRASGFHPLWMMVCVPIFSLARFDLILPLRVLIFVLALLNAGTGILIFRFLKNLISIEISALFALFWVFYPGIHGVTTKLGMESSISAFFIAFLLYKLLQLESGQIHPADSGKRYLKLGIIATLVVLSRLDTIFIVAAIGIWIISRYGHNRFLIISDFGLIIISVAASYFFQIEPGQMFNQYSSSFYWMVGTSLLVKLPIFYFLRLYKPEWNSFKREISRTILALVLGSFTLTLLMLTASRLGFFVGFPRMVLVIDGIITLSGMVIIRCIYGLFQRKNLEENNHPKVTLKTLTLCSLRYFGPIVITLSIYMVASYFYFGTFTPVSGQIKHWWGSLPNTVYGKPINTWEGFVGFFDKGGPWNLIISPLTSLNALVVKWSGLWFLGLIITSVFVIMFISPWLYYQFHNFRKKSLEKSWIYPLFVGCLIHIVMFTGTSYVNMRVWYWIPQMILITVLMGILFDRFFLSILEKWNNNIRVVIASGLIIALLSFSLADLFQVTPWAVKESNKNAYLAGIKSLEAATEPYSVIGSPGGGVVAYFINDRTVVNLDGLMNSTQYFQQLKRYDIDPYLKEIHLDYIYGNEIVITASDPYQEIFRGHLKLLGEVGGSYLYRYNPSNDT